ncbi:MAG: DnaJ domain-containing protein, partial [Rubrivivax sp.]|nr:DnaJ domain-containing protein [Rubrivivax sp.]
MTKERRNLYRILQVQPEAAPAVLKASYRALMSSARMHPDLGGDTDSAATLNRAYEVLSDPEQRRL